MDKDLFLKGVTDKYPDEILDGRLQVEGNVIACLFKDPALVDENPTLTKDFFLLNDARFYYLMVKFLREKHFNVIDEVTIESTLGEDALNQYRELGGFTEIQHMEDVVDLANFDTYLDALFRENTICHMYDDGFDLFKPMKTDKGKDFTPLQLFRKITNAEVLDWYEAKLASYSTTTSSKVTEQGEIDFNDQFIEDCKDGKENGVPFENAGKDIDGDDIIVYPNLSRQALGLMLGTLTFLAAYSSIGKTTVAVAIIMAMLEQGLDVLIISNEEDRSKFQARFLVWYLYRYFKYYKLSKRKLLSGNFTDDDLIMIKKAQAEFNKKYGDRIHFVAVQDMDMNVNKKLIRDYVLNKGVQFVMIDTFKLDFNTASQQRTDLDLVKASRDLDAMAKKYNIIMYCSLQLAMNSKGTLFLTSAQLSNAKQLTENTENLFMMRNVYKEELDETNKNYYLNPYRLKFNENTGKWYEEPFHPDPDKIWRVVFFSKTRSGANSEDNGLALLYSYNGDFASFREEAWCKPRHGFIS